jgi:LysM domain
VAAVAAVLLVAALSVTAAVAAQATGRSGPQPAARQNLVQVLVAPGQSLWSVAESTDPNADPRVTIQRIIDLNGLSGGLIQPGQRLWVPRS